MKNEITPALAKAIDHVKKKFPTLSIICFDKLGNWQYMDEYFGSFKFGYDIDTGILERASASIVTLPAIFQID